MFIAVMVLGLASLIYWAMRVNDFQVPAPVPVADIASESVATSPLAANTPPASEVTPTPPPEPAASKEVSAASATPSSMTSPGATSIPAQANSAQPEEIPLTPGHRRSLGFMRQMNVEEPFIKLHDRLSAEGRDPDWAYAMEQTLNNFFLSRTSQLGIEVSAIACRTTGCEVLMTTAQKPSPLNQLMTAAREESWYKTFTPHQGPTSVFNGVEYFWLILERK
jgi:hypothetical protein